MSFSVLSRATLLSQNLLGAVACPNPHPDLEPAVYVTTHPAWQKQPPAGTGISCGCGQQVPGGDQGICPEPQMMPLR